MCLEEVDPVICVDKGGVHVVQSRWQAVLPDGSCCLLNDKYFIKGVVAILPVSEKRVTNVEKE